MIYIVFCVMKSGCDVIYCVVCDEIWIWNAEIKKNKFFPSLGAMALGKAGKSGTQFGHFAECQAPWHSANEASLPSAMCRHSAKARLCRVSRGLTLSKCGFFAECHVSALSKENF